MILNDFMNMKLMSGTVCRGKLTTYLCQNMKTTCYNKNLDLIQDFKMVQFCFQDILQNMEALLTKLSKNGAVVLISYEYLLEMLLNNIQHT